MARRKNTSFTAPEGTEFTKPKRARKGVDQQLLTIAARIERLELKRDAIIAKALDRADKLRQRAEAITAELPEAEG